MKVPPAPRTEGEAQKWRERVELYLKEMKVAPLTQSISNPPTQAEVAAIQNKLNELIGKIHT